MLSSYPLIARRAAHKTTLVAAGRAKVVGLKLSARNLRRVRAALRRAKAAAGHLVKIELEVDTLDQLAEALEVGVDAVLLDNMTPETMRRAVAMVDGRSITEASGRINLETAPAVAATGVDLISCGWITHSAPILELGLDIAG